MPHKKGPRTAERRSGIFSMLRAMRRRPRTAKELHALSGIPHITAVSRELNRLAAAGLVRPCGVQENGKRGRKPFVWRLA